MAQVTFYLDADTQAIIERAARDPGLSKSRWVAEAVRQYASEGDTWPDECLKLAGRFADFPLCETAASTATATDVPRIGF